MERVLSEAAKLLRASGSYKVSKRLTPAERKRRSDQAKWNFAPALERLAVADIVHKAREAKAELGHSPTE